MFTPRIDPKQILSGPTAEQDYERFKQAYPDEERRMEQLPRCVFAMQDDLFETGLNPMTKEGATWLLENIDKYPACEAVEDDVKANIKRNMFGLQRSRPASPEL